MIIAPISASDGFGGKGRLKVIAILRRSSVI